MNENVNKSRKRWETVMLSKETKESLKSLKNEQSYDALIEAMCTYFIATGYDPFFSRTSPSVDIISELNRLTEEYLQPVKEILTSYNESTIDVKAILKEINKFRHETKVNRKNPSELFIDRNAFEFYLERIEMLVKA